MHSASNCAVVSTDAFNLCAARPALCGSFICGFFLALFRFHTPVSLRSSSSSALRRSSFKHCRGRKSPSSRCISKCSNTKGVFPVFSICFFTAKALNGRFCDTWGTSPFTLMDIFPIITLSITGCPPEIINFPLIFSFLSVCIYLRFNSARRDSSRVRWSIIPGLIPRSSASGSFKLREAPCAVSPESTVFSSISPLWSGSSARTVRLPRRTAVTRAASVPKWFARFMDIISRPFLIS